MSGCPHPPPLSPFPHLWTPLLPTLLGLRSKTEHAHVLCYCGYNSPRLNQVRIYAALLLSSETAFSVKKKKPCPGTARGYAALTHTLACVCPDTAGNIATTHARHFVWARYNTVGKTTVVHYVNHGQRALRAHWTKRGRDASGINKSASMLCCTFQKVVLHTVAAVRNCCVPNLNCHAELSNTLAQGSSSGWVWDVVVHMLRCTLSRGSGSMNGHGGSRQVGQRLCRKEQRWRAALCGG